MSIYTKRGDRGITDMAHAGNISKSDDRIRLMGEADELNSHIELVKSMLRQSEILQLLERIQKNLDLIAAGVSNPYDRDCKVSEKETAVLEVETESTVRKACSGEAYRKEPTGCRDRYCTYCCQKNRALPCTGQREVWRRYRE